MQAGFYKQQNILKGSEIIRSLVVLFLHKHFRATHFSVLSKSTRKLSSNK